jgi:hypothetical protein
MPRDGAIIFGDLISARRVVVGDFVGAINALLGGAGFARGRSELFKRFRIVQESPSRFRCN